MAISRDERRQERRAAFEERFGSKADVALELIEIVELAWHDSYGEITPSPQIVDDLLLLSDGQIDHLVTAAHLALTDWRDLRVAADARRSGGGLGY